MDHPCYKCGNSIEDGKAFCAQCGAPQIRVTIPEAAVEPVLAAEGVIPAWEHGGIPSLPGTSTNALRESWLRDLKPCTLAAAVSIGLTFLGLNPFVAALGTGFLAVTFSRRRAPGTIIRTATGARLGALSGFLFFGVSTIAETLAAVVLHKGAEIRGAMMDKIQQAAARYPGPQVQPFLDFVKTPEGFALMVVGSMVFGLLAFLALGSLGGAAGAAFLGRRGRS